MLNAESSCTFPVVHQGFTVIDTCSSQSLATTYMKKNQIFDVYLFHSVSYLLYHPFCFRPF